MKMKMLSVAVSAVLLHLSPLGAEEKKPETEESIVVVVVGKLQTGVIAIGAETTGVTITAKGITWELDFKEREMLKRRAERLDGKTVRVRGNLERRPGVEIKERWIVTVTALRQPEEPENEG